MIIPCSDLGLVLNLSVMKTPSYAYISNQSDLDDFCQQILANPTINWLAIDTEFVRVDTFYPELSLVQIQTCNGDIAIIDPIAIGSSSDAVKPYHALVEVLASTEVIKVFHSARQDIEVLYLLDGVMPKAIFDTQIAAIFKGHGDLAGFARVIESELNVKLEKSQTRTNWHARPLSEEQIQYAIDDVRYLAPLYEKYLTDLTETQYKAVIEDGNALLDESLYTPNPALAGLKIKNNAKGLRAKNQAVLNALAEWRELFAITHNKPKKWTMSDDVIVNIAKRPPKTVEALYKVPNIKSSSVKEHGETWIELIDEVFAIDPADYPQPMKKQHKASPQEERLINLLQSYIQQVAVDNNISVSKLLNKQQTLDVIRNHPAPPCLFGWRKNLVGDQLHALLAGTANLRIENGAIKLT